MLSVTSHLNAPVSFSESSTNEAMAGARAEQSLGARRTSGYAYAARRAYRVMETADLGNRDDLPHDRCVDGSGVRRVLTEAEVRARAMVRRYERRMRRRWVSFMIIT